MLVFSAVKPFSRTSAAALPAGPDADVGLHPYLLGDPAPAAEQKIQFMTTMIAEVYDALIEAGASEEKARKAAEAIAGYEARFTGIELRLERMDGKITTLSWMVGVAMSLTLALGIGNLFLSLQILTRLPHV